MPHFGPIKRRELIACLRRLGFSGPYTGGKHEFMQRDGLSYHPEPARRRHRPQTAGATVAPGTNHKRRVAAALSCALHPVGFPGLLKVEHLPEVLTPGIVLNALANAAKQAA
jgi:hypothetical protein